MRIAIGSYEIINTSDTITVFAMQIGVTRIGSGGRCMPRTRKGAMTTVANLVLSTPEEKIYAAPVKGIRKISNAGRAVVSLAILVVGLSLKNAINWTQVALGVARVLWFAVIGRPGRIYHTRQSWKSIYAGIQN